MDTVNKKLIYQLLGALAILVIIAYGAFSLVNYLQPASKPAPKHKQTNNATACQVFKANYGTFQADFIALSGDVAIVSSAASNGTLPSNNASVGNQLLNDAAKLQNDATLLPNGTLRADLTYDSTDLMTAGEQISAGNYQGAVTSLNTFNNTDSVNSLQAMSACKGGA